MSTLELPSEDAPAEEWGRLATRIPGWRWMPGMLVHAIVDGNPSMYRLDGADEGLYKKSWILVHESRIYDDTDDVTGLWPDSDDPATAGCFLALLGKRLHIEHGTYLARVVVLQEPAVNGLYPQGEQRTIGRACIAAAAALGRWPGGGA